MNSTITKLSSTEQVEIIAKRETGAEAFSKKMQEVGLFPLKPSSLEILQINVGYMCNQQCVHCHVDASPYRKEIMPKEVMEHCLAVIDSQESKQLILQVVHQK